MGKNRDFLLERAASGKPTPSVANRPDVCPGLEPIWGAFLDLHGSRRSGFSGPEPIAMADIVAAIDLEGVVDVAERREWLRIIRALDMVVMGQEEKTER